MSADDQTNSPTWATVTTLKETLEATLNFVSHHLILGASEIHLYFDDPNDPAIAHLVNHPRVIATPCDQDHWDRIGAPSGPHEKRQKLNARDAYKSTKADWIAHVDADEFISSDVAVPELLKSAGMDVVRLAPFELMSFSKAAHNGRPSHYFKGAVPATPEGKNVAEAAYGEFHSCLRSGLLSHTNGKYFVRTGVEGMELSIHRPFLGGKRAAFEDVQNARLLHMHGGNYDEWASRVKYRLEQGAYMARHEKPLENEGGDDTTLNHVLSDLIERKGDAGLREFYDAVCVFGQKKKRLRRVNALYKENLWLDEKRADVFGSFGYLTNLGYDVGSNALEADLVWDGLKMRVVPDNNYTELLLARNTPDEQEEIDLVLDVVRDKKVLFYDVGGNAGIYSLKVAQYADPASQIIAFEPNPEMLRRFRRNVELNAFENIDIRPIALGRQTGTAQLEGGDGGNLGQAKLTGSGENGLQVDLSTLPIEMRDPADFDLSFMKIDVEGHEAEVFAPLLDPERVSGHLPDFIIMEHVSSEEWEVDLISELANYDYKEHRKTLHNTLLRREKSES